MRADNGVNSMHHCLHALRLSALSAARCQPRCKQVVPQRKNSIGGAANLSVRQKFRPRITRTTLPSVRPQSCAVQTSADGSAHVFESCLHAVPPLKINALYAKSAECRQNSAKHFMG